MVSTSLEWVYEMKAIFAQQIGLDGRRARAVYFGDARGRVVHVGANAVDQAVEQRGRIRCIGEDGREQCPG